MADADLAHAEMWVFDLDNTLYPAHCNLFAQIDAKMGEFICSHFGIALEDAKRQQKGFFNRHGTTLRGLMVEHGLDRSEEHTSELQSLMRISYAVFCLKKKKTISTTQQTYADLDCNADFTNIIIK